MFTDVFKPAEPEPNVLANVNAPGVGAEMHCAALGHRCKSGARLSITTAATTLRVSRKDEVTGCPPWNQKRPLAHN